MNKGQISNLLRKLGLLYPLDHLRFRVEKRRNKDYNRRFKTQNPAINLPPDYLMYESFQINYEKYYSGGNDTAKWIINLLSPHIELENKTILDWGCGPGRIIRHLPALTNNSCKYYATDYNEQSIVWCKNNIEGVNFNLNNLTAELPYASGLFDVIYGISIFTHLSESMHTKWFDELKRVLKPAGLLLLTTQGENFKSKLTETEKKTFENGKLVVRGNVKEGHRTYSAFHPDQYLHELFKDLTIADKIVITPSGKSYVPQDTWILKSPA